MPDLVLAGDLNAGDVIAQPDGQEMVLVRAMRLGRGGFLVTVGPLEAASSAEQVLSSAGDADQPDRTSHRPPGSPAYACPADSGSAIGYKPSPARRGQQGEEPDKTLTPVGVRVLPCLRLVR